MKRKNGVDLYKGKRICKICKIEKNIKEFYLQNNKTIRSTKCKKCYCIDTTKHKNRNKSHYNLLDLKGRLRRTYNCTYEEYLKLIKDTQNKCSICQVKLRKQTKVLDHCHKKNKVRGIICRDCNFGLGNFKDNIKTLIKAIKYLRFK
jgi:hypothetical protein